MFGGGAGFGGWVVIFLFLLFILARWVIVNAGKRSSLLEEREKKD